MVEANTNLCAPVFGGARVGVPQGTVTSPAVFNFFVSNQPITADLNTSYADDFTSAPASISVPGSARCLTEHAVNVAGWADDRGLKISLAKSHVTLFTLDSYQFIMDPGVTPGWRTASPLP